MRTTRLPLIVTGFATVALFLRAEAATDFTKDVAPILKARCVECHGPDKQKGKLRLDTKADFFKGGKGGPSVKAGDADASELLKRVTLPKDNDDRMPPEGEPLTAEQVATLKAWITEGANWPDGASIEVAVATPPPTTTPKLPPRPAVPAPELPKDFQPAPGEAATLAALAKSGIDVRPIAQNSPWREVNLRPLGTNITDASIASFKDLASLIEVRLGSTRITDAGLEAIKGLTHLQVLGLELTGITDAGVAHLAGLKNLMSLNLYGTKVTDAALTHLRDLTHLRNLYLWQTQVTPEGVKKLQEARPGLDINTGVDLAAISTNAPAAKAEEPKK